MNTPDVSSMLLPDPSPLLSSDHSLGASPTESSRKINCWSYIKYSIQTILFIIFNVSILIMCQNYYPFSCRLRKHSRVGSKQNNCHRMFHRDYHNRCAYYTRNPYNFFPVYPHSNRQYQCIFLLRLKLIVVLVCLSISNKRKFGVNENILKIFKLCHFGYSAVKG